MAEAQVEEVAELLEGSTLGQKKKKKCRSKPGRCFNRKERVMVREFWLAEKEADAKSAEKEADAMSAKKKPDAKWGEDEEERKSPSEIKLFDPKSPLFDAYLTMEENFCCKFGVTLPMAPRQGPKTNLIVLSKRLVKLLRWDLPVSEIPYNLYDGSALVLDVARYLRADESDIEMAISEGSGKPRLFLFQHGGKRKICALGGHGFQVLSPLGNWPISKASAASYPDLVHETASGEKIKESGFISAMDRFGGVNFTVGSRGGYRSQADCLVKIEAKNLVLAISLGWEFFENRFTGLVFGAGRWINDSWDGIIPESFLEIVSV